ncbi:aldo/keto reductase [Streptomyces sp. NPDC059155]|uniref:aldo/keto reductase n=1 Tax=Streptomyces sp. NPDC059155 TaxID=3346745 RepID=UPI003695E8AD
MERRTIGAAALAVGAVGLGCMPMHWAYTASRRHGEQSLRTVHAALDVGATLLDTADMYGPFTNELLVGRVLRERRQDAFVSTKVGLLVGDRHVVAHGRPGYVRRACDASLRRLQTDVIDLYQLHCADPEVPVEETWGAMAELVGAGKVRALGVCALGAHGAGAGSASTDTTARGGRWRGAARSTGLGEVPYPGPGPGGQVRPQPGAGSGGAGQGFSMGVRGDATAFPTSATFPAGGAFPAGAAASGPTGGGGGGGAERGEEAPGGGWCT